MKLTTAPCFLCGTFAAALLLPSAATRAIADAKVTIERLDHDGDFKFPTIKPPAIDDLAAKAEITVVGGTLDRNGGATNVLTDGKLPRDRDEPKSNLFFTEDRAGGNLLVDLRENAELAGIFTYSWHTGARAGQNFKVFGAAADAPNLDLKPAPGTDPTRRGWKLIAAVDSSTLRPGQHAAALTPQEGNSLGNFRYLLITTVPNQASQGFGATFFSEIDVIAANAPEPKRYAPAEKVLTTFKSPDGKTEIVLDSTASPDLLPWFEETAIPTLIIWYPKIAKLISIPEKTPPAPAKFRILLKEGQIMRGRDGIPAFASGDEITVSSKFMRGELDREALGCLIHEMVHIVQFGSGKRADRSAPSWLYEGATDYIRWFLFEPENSGAVVRNPDRANYNDSYRTTANFLDFVRANYADDLIANVHIAVHAGYDEEIWKKWTGKSVQELEAEWKNALKQRNANR